MPRRHLMRRDFVSHLIDVLALAYSRTGPCCRAMADRAIFVENRRDVSANVGLVARADSAWVGES